MIDSSGAANSTEASLRVHKKVDFPPVANAGPNQEISLPRNSVTVNGNQSSDDYEIVSYEWSLSPKSRGKVVAMQVNGDRLASFNNIHPPRPPNPVAFRSGVLWCLVKTGKKSLVALCIVQEMVNITLKHLVSSIFALARKTLGRYT